jgi:hypothetical protein
MALFDTNSGLGNLFNGMNIFGTSIPTGILDPNQEEKLRNQALLSGVLGAGATYLATPKNLNTGSALPYLGKAFLGGMSSSQGAVDTALNNAYRQQLLAGKNDPFGTIDISKYTPESISEFQKTKDYGTLKPIAQSRGTNIGNIDPSKFTSESLAEYQQTGNLGVLKPVSMQVGNIAAIDPTKFTVQSIAQYQQTGDISRLVPSVSSQETRGEVLKKSLSPLEMKVEEKSAQDLVDFTIGGGFSDVQKGLSQLEIAKQTLQTQPEGRITGKLVGAQDDTGLLKYTNPAAQDTKEQVQEIAQRNLRLILGPQFTAKEGEALINRVYNPALPQSVNVKRLDLLQEQMTSAAKTKQEAVDYYNTNGTLKGFKGKLYNSTSEFLNEYNTKIKSTEKAPAKAATQQPSGFTEGSRTKSKSGKPMVYRNGQWEYE